MPDTVLSELLRAGQRLGMLPSMNTTLRDFMDAREAAIKEQIKALRAEMAEIKVARQALSAGMTDSTTSRDNASLTIKDMVRAILEAAPKGMTAHDILASIKADYGKDIERTSLSPQLSRLKADNEVWLEGDRWFTTVNWLSALDRRIETFDDNGNEEDDDIAF